mmetsp:Transcript_16919/g.42917  ORF Transcript_16919/g.42917 Transcript_16919/m.42917 type:complete len:224 (-) Transcript_16919:489-1160(-)
MAVVIVVTIVPSVALAALVISLTHLLVFLSLVGLLLAGIVPGAALLLAAGRLVARAIILTRLIITSSVARLGIAVLVHIQVGVAVIVLVVLLVIVPLALHITFSGFFFFFFFFFFFLFFLRLLVSLLLFFFIVAGICLAFLVCQRVTDHQCRLFIFLRDFISVRMIARAVFKDNDVSLVLLTIALERHHPGLIALRVRDKLAQEGHGVRALVSQGSSRHHRRS